MKLGYLGPKGTFTEQAAYTYAESCGEETEYIMFSNITDVIASVNDGLIDEGVVPLENSIEGTVTSTMDTLIFDTSLYIKNELILKISQNLMARKGTKIEDIIKVISHPQGLAQCRKYIKGIGVGETVAVSSTAEAAHIVSESAEPVAAIAPKRSAEVYGLDLLGEDIQDDHTNATRFVIITRKETELKAGMKTSLAFTLDDDNSPGRLYKVLDILNIYEINMIKIESRPAKHKLGTYVFYIDLVAENEEDLKDAVKMLKRKVAFFKFLGSYTSIG
ncbi:MAG: prephenate dehydratase [Clostridiales bacterium]|nr:prephenate dehydratase [Clostridiales bacterium]